MGKNKQQLRQIDALFAPRRNSIEIKSTDPKDCDIHKNRRESSVSLSGVHPKRDSLGSALNGGGHSLSKRDSIEEEDIDKHVTHKHRESVDRETAPATADTYAWLMRRRSSGTKATDGNR